MTGLFDGLAPFEGQDNRANTGRPHQEFENPYMAQSPTSETYGEEERKKEIERLRKVFEAEKAIDDERKYGQYRNYAEGKQEPGSMQGLMSYRNMSDSASVNNVLGTLNGIKSRTGQPAYENFMPQFDYNTLFSGGKYR